MMCENCQNLQQLDLDSCYRITDASVASCKNTLATCDKEESMYGLISLNSLQCLCLSGTSVSDAGLIRLSNSFKSRSSLKELILNKCQKIGDEGISKVLDSFDNLEILSLSHCENVTMISVNNLSRYFENRKSKRKDKSTVNMKQISFTVW